MASISIEDFLKNVFMLITHDGKASTGKLAQRLEVSNAAVTDMSRKLARQNLINYEKYRGIRLTPEGEKIAVGVVRRHRLWELFLNRVLDIPWDKVHDEAERLEHHTSDYVIDKLDKFLDYPEVDPHGDPIPDRSGQFPQSGSVSLIDVTAPTRVVLRRIMEHSENTMQFLNSLHITLGRVFTVISKSNEDRIISIALDEKPVHIPYELAVNFYVEMVD